MRSAGLKSSLALLFAFSQLSSTSGAPAQDHKPAHEAGAMQIYAGTDVEWKDGPGSLAAGSRVAVLEGDPAKEGLFTMRLRLPGGFQIAPHFHSGVEHVTVISGTFHMGTGDKIDRKRTMALTPGSVAIMQPKTTHFAWTGEETVIQVHGVGPWAINYVNPADDPRKK